MWYSVRAAVFQKVGLKMMAATATVGSWSVSKGEISMYVMHTIDAGLAEVDEGVHGGHDGG